MKLTTLSTFLKKALPAFALLAALCNVCQAQPATLVGTLPGEFSVDNKGAANYTIPLQIPPGRSGMQPQLALCYNSNAGNGPLGIGFSLSTGFPQSITRGRSILARDGVVRGVQFDAEDKLYLDGKRLILISGTNGYPGSVYRTEVDSFVTITAFGASDNIEGFRMTTKDGIMLCFGKNVKDSANQTVYTETDGYHMLGGETTGKAYAWALKWVEDTVGNHIEFRYNESAATSLDVPFGDGEHMLTSVLYSGNGRPAAVPPQFRVSLQYNDPQTSPKTTLRPDNGIHYKHGRHTVMNSRLDRIILHAAASPASSPIRVYSLKYKTTPEHASLKLEDISLEDHTAGFVSTRNTEFTWGEPAGTLGEVQGMDTLFSTLPKFVGDFTGNGRKGVLGRKRSTFANGNIFGNLTNTNFAFGDDNKTIVSATAAMPENIAIYVASSSYVSSRIYSLGDFNGDGKTDVVFYVNDQRSNPNPHVGGWYASLATGSGFAAAERVIVSTTYPRYPGTTIVRDPELITDIDGDGLDDLIYCKSTVSSQLYLDVPDITYGPNEIYAAVIGSTVQSIMLPSGTTLFIKSPKIDASGSLSFKPETQMTNPFAGPYGSSTALVPMDMNGDGLTDFLGVTMVFNSDPDFLIVEKGYRLWSTINTINNGTNALLAPQRIGTTGNEWNWIEEYYDYDHEYVDGKQGGASIYMIGDVNGDGLDDIVFLSLNADRNTSQMLGGWTVHLSKGDGTFDSETFSGNKPFAIPASVLVGSGTVPTYNQRPGKIKFDYTEADFWNELRLASNEGFDIRGVLLMDYNGDGKKDFVWYTDAAGWQCLLATGTGFDYDNPIAIQAPQSVAFEYNKTTYDRYGNSILPGQSFGFLAQAVDLDGDGRDDILLLESVSENSRPLTKSMNCIFSPSTDANHIIAIQDGLGAITHIEYTPTTRDSVYTPGVSVSYPIREDRRPQHVVSSVRKDSGSDNPADHAHFSYQYSGNRLDLSGRGPLGFHSFVTLDHQTNLFKYQFLTQSFPMTGLAMREQTYRFWEDGSQSKFRLISSHDNTVVFDLVANPANNTAWGTVYPFISAAIESRWEDSTTAHYTLSAADPSSQPETIFTNYTQLKPPGAHITISATSLFDLQTSAPTTLPGAYNPGDLSSSGSNTVTGYLNYSDFQALASAFPKQITHGNLAKLTTDFGDGFTETIATTYFAPTPNGLTGLVSGVTTTVTSPAHGTQTAPVKSYTYATINSTPTPLLATEVTTATDPALTTTITHTRDTLGRITATALTGYNSPNDPRHIGTYTTSQATAFDSRFDLPTTTQNAYAHPTITAYHATLALPTSVTDVNNAQITTTYDPLGRAIQTRNELLNLQTDITYAWTTNSANDWQATQTVTPPPSLPGALTLDSTFAIRTAATAQPAVTTYHDRLGRPIRTIKEGFNGQLIHADTIYNNLGQIVATSLPYPANTTPLWTKTTYDPLGRPATSTAPNGVVTTSTYAGRATAVTIAGSGLAPQTNVTLVDAKGRTTKVWNADNAPSTSTLDPIIGSLAEASIEYTLDGFGLMRETILRGQSQKILATYDALGHQISLNDPDKGHWAYTNNALGQVVQQTDANLNTTLSTFDRLGRPLTRDTVEPAGGPFETARWYYYDTTADPSRHLVAQGAKGWIGALQREESTTTGAPGYAALMPGTTTIYYYDDKGRPEITLRTIDNEVFYTNTAYDAYSRVSQINHFWRHIGNEHGNAIPHVWEDFGYTHTYDTRSYLLALHDTTPQQLAWWEADTTAGYDHLDRPVLVRKGNAHWTQRTYRPEDSVLTNIKTGPTPGSATIQNLAYNFDPLGNLTTRANANKNLTETFAYDNLNRLTTRNGATIATYAINGNITSKVDVSNNPSGAYTYSPTKPHAVTNAWGYTMTYDNNGNLLTRTGNGATWSTQWTGFDKPRWLAKTDNTTGATTGSEFLYNANRSRIMHLEFDTMTSGVPSHYTRKKIYMAGPDVEIDYKNTAASGLAHWQRETVRAYITAPDGTVGTLELSSTGILPVTKSLIYHTDHLGSIESITTHGDTTTTLALDDRNNPSLYSYDPWGERRNPLTWLGKPATTDLGGPEGTASRGYTGHEMLDSLGLVHMNGRIYDPLLGRMLSADLLVKDPANLQDYNRYSYVGNNPLSRVDPTGFLETTITEEQAKKLKDATEELNKRVNTVVQAVLKDVRNGKLAPENAARAVAIQLQGIGAGFNGGNNIKISVDMKNLGKVYYQQAEFKGSIYEGGFVVMPEARNELKKEARDRVAQIPGVKPEKIDGVVDIVFNKMITTNKFRETVWKDDQVAGGINLNGFAIGTDKLDHMFYDGFQIHRMSEARAREESKSREEGMCGLKATGVYSNGDIEANMNGWRFYREVLQAAKDNTDYNFDIRNFNIRGMDENINPNRYAPLMQAVIDRNTKKNEKE